MRAEAGVVGGGHHPAPRQHGRHPRDVPDRMGRARRRALRAEPHRAVRPRHHRARGPAGVIVGDEHHAGAEGERPVGSSASGTGSAAPCRCRRGCRGAGCGRPVRVGPTCATPWCCRRAGGCSGAASRFARVDHDPDARGRRRAPRSSDCMARCGEEPGGGRRSAAARCRRPNSRSAHVGLAHRRCTPRRTRPHGPAPTDPPATVLPTSDPPTSDPPTSDNWRSRTSARCARRHEGHGRSRSAMRARSRRSSSWWWRPMICIPTGRPSKVPTGIDTAGLPAKLAGKVRFPWLAPTRMMSPNRSMRSMSPTVVGHGALGAEGHVGVGRAEDEVHLVEEVRHHLVGTRREIARPWPPWPGRSGARRC